MARKGWRNIPVISFPLNFVDFYRYFISSANIVFIMPGGELCRIFRDCEPKQIAWKALFTFEMYANFKYSEMAPS